MMASSESLLECATDPKSRAHLLAATSRYAGAWLDALPISSLGLRMDDETVRIAVGLRLGSSVCTPHPCCHCGALVNHLGTHGLSCRQSEGRHYRHAAMCTGPCQLPRFLLALNLQALAAQMGRDQMEYLWCPGLMVNSLSGMLHP